MAYVEEKMGIVNVIRLVSYKAVYIRFSTQKLYICLFNMLITRVITS